MHILFTGLRVFLWHASIVIFTDNNLVPEMTKIPNYTFYLQMMASLPLDNLLWQSCQAGPLATFSQILHFIGYDELLNSYYTKQNLRPGGVQTQTFL
jgi:hypothetical protein